MSIFDFFKKKTSKPASRVSESSQVNNNVGNDSSCSKEQDAWKEQSQDYSPNGNPVEPNGKAHIYNLVIIDESGSMSNLSDATVSGVNETIGTIRQAQEEFGDKQDHFLTIVTFDSPGRRNIPVRTLVDRQPIANVQDFSNYHPYGCTPLYDAMGQSIMGLYNAIKDDPDASAVVTVLTDGLENASHEFSGRQLGQLIEKLKKEGWTFSYMGSAHDVKSVSDLLSIDNVMEFSHDRTGARNTWKRERSAKMKHFRSMNMDWECMKGMPEAMKRRHLEGLASQYYQGRVTPSDFERIQRGPEDVFVFGSSIDGSHDGGCARYAVEHFGAIYGQGVGPQGQSYAIPTMVPFPEMARFVNDFVDYAAAHPDRMFYVTAIGCGSAGYPPAQIAPLFEECIHLENVALPIAFWEQLGISMLGKI